MVGRSKMGAQVWSLISLGVGLNLLFGAIVALFKIPLYQDSFGTVLVASLAGPVAGAMTGVCGVALLGMTSPTALAFFPVAAAVGLLTGLWARLGGFRGPFAALCGGAMTGVIGAALAAPIATFFYGGVTGGGTDLLVAIFRSQGVSALLSSFWQGLAVDPLDKAVTCLAVTIVLRGLPPRTLLSFPLGGQLVGEARRPAPYRPIALSRPRIARSTRPDAELTDKGQDLPPAEPMLKTLVLFSTLILTALLPRDRWQDAGLILVGVVGAHLTVAPRLTIRLLARLVLTLAPLGASLLLISSLLVDFPGETRLHWLGLSWSVTGLGDAIFFLTRAGLLLWTLSVYFATTPLPRVGEVLLRLKVPYPLVYVILTGADLTRILRQRWLSVEQAQRARGLAPASGGLFQRWDAFLRILVPTIGSVFAELPVRAAALESRGLLSARPRARLPRAWLKEPEPSRLGWIFQTFLLLATWSAYLWL